MGKRTDRDQIIPDRRIEAALHSTANDHDSMQAVRDLIDEAYRRGMSAGQMKARLTGKSLAEAYDEGYKQCRQGGYPATYGSNLNPYRSAR